MFAIDAFADAIMQFEGWHIGSRSWRNRNPGNLRPTSDLQARDADGYRIFISLAQGYSALMNDLEVKCGGYSSHKLTPQSTILDLINVYAPAGDANNPTDYTKFICKATSASLNRTILPTTTLEEYRKP
jgi:hypothetical protein